MEGWKDGRMEGWKRGRMEGWKVGRLEGWKVGRGEGWKDGRLEGWKVGRLEGWKRGRLVSAFTTCTYGEVLTPRRFKKLLKDEHLARSRKITRSEGIEIDSACYGFTHLICPIPIGSVAAGLIHANILMS